MTYQQVPGPTSNPHQPVQFIELQEARRSYPSSTQTIQQDPFYSPLQRNGPKHYANPRVVLRPAKLVRKPLEYEDIYDKRPHTGVAAGTRHSMREGRRFGGHRAMNGALRNSGDFTGAHEVIVRHEGTQQGGWVPRSRNGSIGNYPYVVDPRKNGNRNNSDVRNVGKEVRELGTVVVNKGGSVDPRNTGAVRNQGDVRGTQDVTHTRVPVDDGDEIQHEHYSRDLRPGEVGWNKNAINLGQIRVIVDDRKGNQNHMGITSNTEGQNNPSKISHLRLVVDENDSSNHHLVPAEDPGNMRYIKEHDRDTRNVGQVRVVVKKESSNEHYVSGMGNAVDTRYNEDIRGTRLVRSSEDNNTHDYVRNVEGPRGITGVERVMVRGTDGQNKDMVNNKDYEERREPTQVQNRPGANDGTGKEFPGWKPHQLSFPRNVNGNEEGSSSNLLNNEQNDPKPSQRQHVIATVITDTSCRDDSPDPQLLHVNPDIPRSVSPALSLGSNASGQSHVSHNSGVSVKSEVSVKSILKKPKVGRIVMKEEPSAFFPLAVVSCILCFPFGIYALVNSANVKNAVEDNDYEWALSSSKKVKHFCFGVAIAYFGILVLAAGLLAKYFITGKLF